MQNPITLKFIRNEGSSGFTSMALACCTLRDNLVKIVEGSPNAAEFVCQKVSCAVTAWMKNTDEGYEALSSTNNDFNVGDLVEYLDSEELKGYLAEEGILEMKITTHDQGNALNFDRHLFDWEEVES
jgi:hypothetical protein